jgi:cobalt/nickel transport system permease protein
VPLRSFGRRGKGPAAYVGLLGHLLLRTLDRAERIHQAMLARGFDGEIHLLRPLRFHLAEWAFLLGWTALFAVMRTVDVARLLGELAGGALP